MQWLHTDLWHWCSLNRSSTQQYTVHSNFRMTNSSTGTGISSITITGRHRHTIILCNNRKLQYIGWCKIRHRPLKHWHYFNSCSKKLKIQILWSTYVFGRLGKNIDLEQNWLSYAILSAIMSKIKNWIKITQCHHIQSFSRGHPGGFNSDSVSLIHCKVRVGGPTKK